MINVVEELSKLVRLLPSDANYGFYKPQVVKTIMATLSKHFNDDDDVNDVFQDLMDDLDINEQDESHSLLIISFKDPSQQKDPA